MRKSKKDTVIYLLCSIGIMSIFYIGGGFKKRSLDKNIEYSQAVVTRFYGFGGQQNFNYTFFANKKEYKGGSRYYYNSVNVGDTIIVGYDTTNPKNNKVCSYENVPHLYLIKKPK